jgi:hypothetical protein
MTKTFKEWYEEKPSLFPPTAKTAMSSLSYAGMCQLVDEYISECAPLRTAPTNRSVYTHLGLLHIVKGALILDGEEPDNSCVKMIEIFERDCNEEGEYLNSRKLTLNPDKEAFEKWLMEEMSRTPNS